MLQRQGRGLVPITLPSRSNQLGAVYDGLPLCLQPLMLLGGQVLPRSLVTEELGQVIRNLTPIPVFHRK